ncbi:G-protein-coupled receptor family 3 protein 6 [Cavenderia fasciculata]|uniref:G-protein-coupled receptor family 3 protein 6 n=1 Tax=Cavenderia fasciculata TaxID=261658 RepID=F4PGI0_CACFS|nr:G-protein-coupled receptor family 3 protein 6 [Cavenderia fasciculata]EGG24814.1 G-protein-coupled receptor family 3 protein 6 [Cavenderia fasciculata]|eukprot:XP_004362665.1 G-protein-coupled receptor family 3 protein 6 [Cavenderia fasciculata]
MIKLSIYLILSIFLFLLSPSVNGAEVKFALIMSGNVTDLGFNFMVNDGRIRMERELKLQTPTIAYSMIDTDQKLKDCIEEIIDLGYNFIFPSSQIHMDIATAYANKTQGKGIYWMLRGRAKPTLENVVNVGFNSGTMQFLIGYFAGLETKTGNIGFIAPGNPVQKAFTFNSFYIGAKTANPNVNVWYAYTLNWMDPDRARGASRKMLDEHNVDMIGQSQDDMSVQEEVMATRLNFGLGSTGYSERLIYGDQMGISYLTNWTVILTRFAERIQDGNWTKDAFQGELSNGAIEFDEMSFRVKDTTITAFNLEREKLRSNITYQPYRCNQGYMTEYGTQCVNMSSFWGATMPITPLEYNLGLYTIPVTNVPIQESITLGLSIPSGVFILFAIVSIVVIILFRNAKVIKSASPLFSVLILIGCILIFAGIIIWSQNPTTSLCRSRIWLISLGYTLMIGNLLIKNFRIWLLFDNPKLKRRNIPNKKLIPWFLGILILDAIILAVWIAVGDIKAVERLNIDGLGTYESMNACSSSHAGDVVLYILLIFHGIMLLVGCFISFKIRSVDIKEFNECGPVSTCLYAIAFCLFIVIPLMVSPQSIANQTIIICACGIFTTFSSMAILFLPKFGEMYTQGPAINETFRTNTNRQDTFTIDISHNTVALAQEGVTMETFTKTTTSSNEVTDST